MANRMELDQRIGDLGRVLSDADLAEALLTLMVRRGRDGGDVLTRLAAEWPAEESVLLDAAASLAARHHALQGAESRLRSWLGLLTLRSDLARQLGGTPHRVLDETEHTVLAQATIQGEAMRTIWREPMLEPRDTAVALGARGTNRENVRTYRKRSWLLGLPAGRGYVYPALQFDAEWRDVFPEVRAVNERLDAAGDPWGVASWWIFRHARLDARPVELVGTDRADDLARVAEAAIELVG
ncbi:MAG: hypothetical protein OXN91_01475 [Chloroflexota bacterium]|nr:hypothetical protein [Chloroflexota bacterium]